MTVIVATNTPPAVRGMLKRWFIEPKANVFVGTVNQKVRDKVLDYIRRNADGLNLLVITSGNNCQKFKIVRFGKPDRVDLELSGNWLIAEKLTGQLSV
jgi:CRISPR-associated protein Cas2